MKGFRTLLFNIVGIGSMALTTPELGAIIPKKATPYILGVVCVGNIILRTVTTTPIGQKEVTDVNSTGNPSSK